MGHKYGFHIQSAAVQCPGGFKRFVQCSDRLDVRPGKIVRGHVGYQNQFVLFRRFGKQEPHICADGKVRPQGAFPFFHAGEVADLALAVCIPEAVMTA